MKIRYYSMWILIVYILQVNISNYGSLLKIVPNFLLIFLVITALKRGSVTGSIMGLVLGLLTDVVCGRVFGVNTLLYMYIGLLVGLFCRKFFRNSFIPLVSFVFVSSFLYNALFAIFNLKAVDLQFEQAMVDVILPECLCNIIFAIPLYHLFCHTYKKFVFNLRLAIGEC